MHVHVHINLHNKLSIFINLLETTLFGIHKKTQKG